MSLSFWIGYLTSFFFFPHGHAPYHSQKKTIWANSGARAGLKGQVPSILVRAHQFGCARARIIFYFLFCFEWYAPKKHTMPKKIKSSRRQVGRARAPRPTHHRSLPLSQGLRHPREVLGRRRDPHLLPVPEQPRGGRCVFLVACKLVAFGKLPGVSFELHESQNARVKKPYRVPPTFAQFQLQNNDSKPTSCSKRLTRS